MEVKRILVIVLVLAAVLFGAAFAAPDTVAVYAVRSFNILLLSPGVSVTRDDVEGAWTVRSPGGETLTFGGDDAAGSNNIVLRLGARPFLAAGLKSSL
jgi:hypothetical protein